MGSKFQVVPLEEVVTIHDAKRKPITKADRKSGPYPYYGASDIADYIDGYVFDGVYLLLSEDGDNLRTRNTPIAFIASGKFWVNNHAHVLQGQDELDTIYLCYALQHAEIDSYISGSTRPKITQIDLKKIPIFAPELKIRRQIAKFVKAFDEKLALNRQINKTLEQIAQTLFKSWFVDFDPVVDNALDTGFFEQDLAFPDELLSRAEARRAVREQSDFKQLPDATRQLFPSAFEECVEPSLGLSGWVPQGWAVSHLSDFGNIITGKTPSKSVKDAFGNMSNENLPFITPTDMGDDTHMQETVRYLSPISQSILAKSKIKKGSICVSCIGSQMGKTMFVDCDAFTNQQINSIVLNDVKESNFLFCFLRLNRDTLFKLGCGGSTMPILNKNDFSKINLLHPSKKLTTIFSGYTEVIFNKISKNLNQNSTLENLRDALLPKLISGELRLDNIDAELAKVEVA